MKNRFDLEQEIMECWGIVDDLKAIEDAILGSSDFAGMEAKYTDKIANLLSMRHLYQLKFERLWDTFENCIKYKNIGDEI